jgi:hypothetical protein
MKHVKSLIAFVSDTLATMPQTPVAWFEEVKLVRGSRTFSARLEGSEQLFTLHESGSQWGLYIGLHIDRKFFITWISGDIGAARRKAPHLMALHLAGKPADEKVTFEIPGGPRFDILAYRSNVEDFLAKLKALPTKPPRHVRPKATGFIRCAADKCVFGGWDSHFILCLQDADYRKAMIRLHGEKYIREGEDRILTERGLTRADLAGSKASQETPELLLT